MKKEYVVITGSSSGIGYALAEEYAKAGYPLILVARRIEPLHALKEAFPEVDIQTVQADLSDSDQVLDFYEFTRKFTIHHFINNAGFGDFAYAKEADLNKLEKMLNLNVRALTLLSIAFLKDYGDKKAILTNISSIAGYAIVNPSVTYSASKFYVSAFTEGLAIQYANAPVKIKVVAPAATESDFAKTSIDADDFDYASKVPKYHSAQEMAKLIMDHAQNDHVLAIVNTNSYEMEYKSGQFPSIESQLMK